MKHSRNKAVVSAHTPRFLCYYIIAENPVVSHSRKLKSSRRCCCCLKLNCVAKNTVLVKKKRASQLLFVNGHEAVNFVSVVTYKSKQLFCVRASFWYR